MFIFRSIFYAIRDEILASDAPEVHIKASKSVADFNPGRFDSQDGEMFREADKLSKKIKRQIYYWSILNYALENEDFLAKGEVIKSPDGGTLGFIPTQNFVTYDADGRKDIFIQGQIIIGHQSTEVFEQIQTMFSHSES